MGSPPTAPPKPRWRTTPGSRRWTCARKIRVNAIAPGSILTSALEIVASNDALRDPMEKATPMRRLGDPLDIAAAAVYLASPAASFLTGKMLEVDGGLIVPNLDLPIPDL